MSFRKEEIKKKETFRENVWHDGQIKKEKSGTRIKNNSNWGLEERHLFPSLFLSEILSQIFIALGGVDDDIALIIETLGAVNFCISFTLRNINFSVDVYY